MREDLRDVLEQINNDKLGDDNELTKLNDGLVKNYDKRNEIYTKTLNKFSQIEVDKARLKYTQKKIFFLLACIIIVCVILLTLLTIVYSFKFLDGSDSLVAIISALVSLTSTILVIPTIIANNLFPKEEERIFIEMLQNMQTNDKDIMHV